MRLEGGWLNLRKAASCGHFQRRSKNCHFSSFTHSRLTPTQAALMLGCTCAKQPVGGRWLLSCLDTPQDHQRTRCFSRSSEMNSGERSSFSRFLSFFVYTGRNRATFQHWPTFQNTACNVQHIFNVVPHGTWSQ